MQFHQTRYTQPNKIRGPFAETFQDPYPPTYAETFGEFGQVSLSEDIFDPENIDDTIWHIYTHAENPYFGLTEDDIQIVSDLLDEIKFLVEISPGENECSTTIDDDSLTIVKATDVFSSDYHLSHNKVVLTINGIVISWYFKIDQNGEQVKDDEITNLQKDTGKPEIIYNKSEANKAEFNSTGYTFSWSDGHPLRNRDVTKFIYKKRSEKDPRFLADFPVGKKGKEAPTYTIPDSKYTYYAFDTGLDDPMTDDDNLRSDLFKGIKELELAHDGKLPIGPNSPAGDYIIKIQQGINSLNKFEPDYEEFKLVETGIYDSLTKEAVRKYQIDRKLISTDGIVGQETITSIDGELSPAFSYLLGVIPANVPTQQQFYISQGQPDTYINRPPVRSSYDESTSWPATEYFEGQQVISPQGSELLIPYESVIVCNDKGQVEVFYIDNKLVKGLFVYTIDRMTWVRTEDGAAFPDLWEDAIMRESEPVSWGIHLAAKDLGNFVIHFVDDPWGSVVGLWEAIKGLKDLDIDKTWERIKNADTTDVAYVMTTLFLAKVGSPKLPGASAAAISGVKTLFSGAMKYGEEIYRFLRKYNALLVDSITNAELYAALRPGASAALGRALKIGGEVGATGFQAHHIIPMELIKWPGRVGDFVRKAYDSMWEMNGKDNGIWVQRFKKGTELIEEEGVHATHPNYTARVAERIDAFIETFGGKEITGPEAKAFLDDLSRSLKELIDEQSVQGTTKIDNLTF